MKICYLLFLSILWLLTGLASAQESPFSIIEGSSFSSLPKKLQDKYQSSDKLLAKNNAFEKAGYLKSSNSSLRKGDYTFQLFSDVNLPVIITDSAMFNNGNETYLELKGKVKGLENKSEVRITYRGGRFKAEIQAGKERYAIWEIKDTPHYFRVVKASHVPLIF